MRIDLATRLQTTFPTLRHERSLEHRVREVELTLLVQNYCRLARERKAKFSIFRVNDSEMGARAETCIDEIAAALTNMAHGGSHPSFVKPERNGSQGDRDRFARLSRW